MKKKEEMFLDEKNKKLILSGKEICFINTHIRTLKKVVLCFTEDLANVNVDTPQLCQAT